MTPERLEPRDWKVLLLWLLVGCAGAAVAWKYFFVAFPEASVDFRVSRPAALEHARRFVADQDGTLEGYRSTIVFDVDDNAKTYLERELGLAQANRLMASEINVWHWHARFFQSGKVGEYGVEISPAGAITGYSYTMEENRAGARLDEAAARARAEQFLRDRAGIDLSQYDFLPEEANPTERPNRRDWNFTWERRGFKIKDAPYRLQATIQGEHIGGFSQSLKVPEGWKRDFERLRSSNEFYQAIAEVGLVFLYGCVVTVLVSLARLGALSWLGALRLAAVLAVLFFVNAMNEWPLTLAGYDTKSTLSAFVVSKLALAILSSIAVGLSVALALAAAEPVYRRDFPDKLRLDAMFRIDGIRTKSFFRSCWIGLALAGAHIGFVVVFYVAGRHFGIWAPQDVKYNDMVSTAVPWISPLAIALYAATNEEFLFRLFAIPFFLRLTKSRVVAVVLPAFMWGFLHSAYQVEPGYARGIEVGLIGIVAGLVMLRWGILTTLVWHYTVDALLIGLFLLRSESLYFRVSGAVVAAFVVIPLGVAGIAALVHGGFLPEAGALNRAKPLEIQEAEKAAAPARAVEYVPCSSRQLTIALAAGLVGIALVLAVKPEVIGSYLRVPTDARQAKADADQILRDRHVDPASYKYATTFVGTYVDSVNEYLRRQIGIAGANRLYEQEVPSAFWAVRYFRDSQKEEYNVILTPEGALHSVHHLLDENAPGAGLSKEQAQAKAEAYLRDVKHLDLAQWKLVAADSKKLPARTEHAFSWEKRDGIGEAHVRKDVQVQGDEVAGYRVYVHVPEEWQRELARQTISRTLYAVGRLGLAGATIIAMLVLFFRNIRKSGASVPWRRMAYWALWAAAGLLIILACRYADILSNYPTQFPFRLFVAISIIFTFLIVALAFSALYFLLGLAWFHLARAFGSSMLPRWLGMPAAYYRDAVWLGLAGAAVMAGLDRLPFLAMHWWPTPRPGISAVLPGSLDSLLPFLPDAAGAAMRALFTIGLLGLVAGFMAANLRTKWLRAGFLLLLALSLTDAWGSPADFVKQFLLRLIFVAVICWGGTRILRFNMLGYFLALMTAGLASQALELLQQPNGFYRVNGLAALTVILALVVWTLFAARREPYTAPRNAESGG